MYIYTYWNVYKGQRNKNETLVNLYDDPNVSKKILSFQAGCTCIVGNRVVTHDSHTMCALNYLYYFLTNEPLPHFQDDAIDRWKGVVDITKFKVGLDKMHVSQRDVYFKIF